MCLRYHSFMINMNLTIFLLPKGPIMIDKVPLLILKSQALRTVCQVLEYTKDIAFIFEKMLVAS